MENYYGPDGEHFDRSDIEDQFDNMFNEIYEPIRFGGLTYEPAQVLKDVDPIAYREEVNSYIDSLIQDGELFEEDEE